MYAVLGALELQAELKELSSLEEDRITQKERPRMHPPLMYFDDNGFENATA